MTRDFASIGLAFALILGFTVPADAGGLITGEGVIVESVQGTIEIVGFNGGNPVSLYVPNTINIHNFYMHELVKYAYKIRENDQTVSNELYSMSEIKHGAHL